MYVSNLLAYASPVTRSYDMKNNAYYTGVDGNQIMNTGNFNKSIIRYLNYEKAFISKILAKNTYCTLIELGCDEVSLYGSCAMNMVRYIGIDIRKGLSSFNNEYLLKNKHIEGKFINTCVSEFYDLVAIEKKPILCVFPFNLIGNLDDCETHAQKCFDYNLDIIISQFNTTDMARSVRYEYYCKCGIKNLIIRKFENGDVFQGSEFESISYYRDHIMDCFINTGFKCIDDYISDLICLYHFSKEITQ
jgi:hypothetical protein